jgi:hypothetical protein
LRRAFPQLLSHGSGSLEPCARVAHGSAWLPSAVARPGQRQPRRAEDVQLAVHVLSGASGRLLHVLADPCGGERFGSRIDALHDVDGDGLGDYAVGYGADSDIRVAILSGRDFAVLRELR